MGSNYILSLQPTFTQGLILGQLSILFLLAIILKYLFIDTSEPHAENASYHPGIDVDASLRANYRLPSRDAHEGKGTESAEWFNMLLQQVRFKNISVRLLGHSREIQHSDLK